MANGLEGNPSPGTSRWATETNTPTSDVELLTQRVSYLEQEVEGEKLVTRHILEQTRRNAGDLAAIKGCLGRMESQLGDFAIRFDRSDAELCALRRDLPGIIADTLREVLREQDR